jgi:nucleotide-binding universal stress UspA family protein
MYTDIVLYGKEAPLFERILLAVDGSEHALHAAKIAGDLARAMRARELRIVAAYEPVPAYLGEPNLSNAINTRLHDVETTIQEARDAVGETPAELLTGTLEGSIAEAIINTADAHHSDLIVMGSRGRGRLAGAILGSNSQKVVSEASCPVLIVR